LGGDAPEKGRLRVTDIEGSREHVQVAKETAVISEDTGVRCGRDLGICTGGAGVGAIAALTLGDDLGLSEREGPRSLDEQSKAPQPRGKDAAEQEEAASHQDEAEYVSTVGDIQARAVETFLDSHHKPLHYDALTAEDVEELQANEAALRGLTAQVDDVDSPRRYGRQYEVFRSAIDDLHEAALLTYDLAADLVAAAEFGFDGYDSHVNEAAALVRRSTNCWVATTGGRKHSGDKSPVKHNGNPTRLGRRVGIRKEITVNRPATRWRCPGCHVTGFSGRRRRERLEQGMGSKEPSSPLAATLVLKRNRYSDPA